MSTAMAPSNDMADREHAETQRLDKWLWFARVVKSRTLAAQLVLDGKIRLNRARVTKPSQSVRTGDVLTIAVRSSVRVLRIQATGQRRGPPAEASQLYEIVGDRENGPTPPAPPARRNPGAGRPSKRDRRLIDRLADHK